MHSSLSCTARRNQIIDDENILAFTNTIGVDFDGIRMTASASARRLVRSVVISRYIIPGLGKSGIVRMASFKFID